MNLKPFIATFTWAGGLVVREIEIWVANKKAAHESAEAYAREEGMPAKTKITIRPS